MEININALPKPKYRAKVNVSDAFNSDIIKTLEKNYPEALRQSKEFAKSFKTNSRLETARKIWTFLRSKIIYKKDNSRKQLIRLPSRFVHSKNGDCKSYSLLTASILGNLGLPVTFRYASYNSSKVPTHVYVVTKDEQGKDIIIDGVYKYFNKQKPPQHLIDHKMDVITLSGTDEIGKISFKKFGKVFKKIGKGIKKIGLAVPRRAFRTLVALNVGGLGSKLARAYKKNPAAVFKLWNKLGGKSSALMQSFSKGAKRKRILGIENVEEINGIGAAVGIPAILAAAAPIIAAIVPLLKSLGADKEGKEAGESTLDKIEAVAKSATDNAQSSGGSSYGGYSNPLETPEKFEPEATKTDEPTGFEIKPVFLLIGAAGLFFLLSKNKK